MLPPVRVSSMVLFDLVDDDGEALSRWTRDWSPTEGMGVAFAACEPLTQSVHAENAETWQITKGGEGRILAREIEWR